MSLKSIFAQVKARLSKAGEGQSGSKPRSSLSDSDQKFIENLLTGVTAQVLHEQEMVKARGTEAVSVRLVPQLPVRDRNTPAAWLGGGACLPPGMAWPQSNGSALQLLAQFDCAQLPAGLWQGLGPRDGWLAIFVDPMTIEAQVLHFPEAGAFHRAPPVPKDCVMVSYDTGKRAAASGYTWGFPRWPVDIVTVHHGRGDPRKDGHCPALHVRYRQRYDIVSERLVPFDWTTAQLMMDLALAAYEGRGAKGNTDAFKPETLTRLEQAINDAERDGADAEAIARQRVDLEDRRAMAAVHDFAARNGAAITEQLRTFKADVERMAANQPFSLDAIASVLDGMRSMTWTHKDVPPFFRDGKQLPHAQRLEEGVRVFSLPLTSHAPSLAPSWVWDFEMRLREAAKLAYLDDPSTLPAELVGHCESAWADMALHDAGGMGHVPWGYVHEFDDGEDVTLIELPSSDLIGWMFGDVDHLVITLKASDLARSDFSRPLVQITN